MASNGVWSVAEGVYDGKPILTRIRTDLRDGGYESRFPFRLGVAMPLLHPQEDGMPIPEENVVLSGVEDVIHETVEAPGKGVLCAIVTTHGMKEFVMYVEDERAEVVRKIQEVYSQYHVQHYIVADKTWIGYRQLFVESGMLP